MDERSLSAEGICSADAVFTRQRFPRIVRRKLHVDPIGIGHVQVLPAGVIFVRDAALFEIRVNVRDPIPFGYLPKNDPCQRVRGLVRLRCSRDRASHNASASCCSSRLGRRIHGRKGLPTLRSRAREISGRSRAVKCNGASAAFATAHAARVPALSIRTASRRLIIRAPVYQTRFSRSQRLKIFLRSFPGHL